MLSMTLLSLEIAWTRLFSAEFYYAYAFLVLSLAIMGLGFGALTLRLIPILGLRRYQGVMLSIAGCTALAGPLLVFRLGLKFSELAASWGMLGRFAVAVLLLSLPYFLGGICLAAIFRRNHRQMPRLYMADLLGAGVGVALSVVLMNRFGTPAATFLMVVPLLLSAVLAGRGAWRLAPVLLAAAPLVMCMYADQWLEVPRQERAPVIYKHWDATSKLKVYDYGPTARGLCIDNVANSPVYAFDGNWDRPESDQFQFGIDVSNLIKRFDHCTFLSLGAGGGGDVLQAMQAGAKEIHAVEVNPYINEMMLTGYLADYTGHIYTDPRVHVFTEDARAYARRYKNKFDVIYSLSSNTFAAIASGSFAMAENYLFTTEAFRDYWNSLSDGGFMMMEHQFYVPRLTASLVDALQGLGVPDPKEHFAIYDLPQMRRQMILLSKRPLTDEIRDNAFGELTEENYAQIHLLYPAPEPLSDNQINRIVTEGWRAVAQGATIDVSPATDNCPFVGQMGLWKNLRTNKAGLMGMDVTGYPLSKLILLSILGVVVVLAIPLNLLPYLGRRPRLRAAPWLYFFTIGVAFMSVEVVLIQKYTLFVGPTVYSISTILLTLLVASGIGSRFAAKVPTRAAFTALIAWLLLEAFVLQHITNALAGMTLTPRLVLSVILVAPLGFFLGMPFPKAALRVGSLVDWGFAVNGAASVLGGTGILLVAMALGYQLALLLAAILYALAYLLISKPNAWTSSTSPHSAVRA